MRAIGIWPTTRTTRESSIKAYERWGELVDTALQECSLAESRCADRPREGVAMIKRPGPDSTLQEARDYLAATGVPSKTITGPACDQHRDRRPNGRKKPRAQERARRRASR